MSIQGIIIATVTVGGVGVLIGVFLSIFGNIFKVEVDEREAAIEEALPGNNCGGCGFPGCSGLAAAIAKGEAPVNQCPSAARRLPKRLLRSWALKLTRARRWSPLSNATEPVS